MYQEFNILFPYLQSVRKLKNYLSFDIEFPDSWKLPKKFVDEKSVMENKTTTPNTRLFSFVTEFNETSVDSQITNIKNIISYNKEREEKDRLFQQKIDELKHIFEKQKLNDLQGLKFELKTPKIELEDDEEEKQIGV
jgi:cysteinyl-tRNA synthetase